MYVIKYKTVFGFLTSLFNAVKRVTAHRVSHPYKTGRKNKRELKANLNSPSALDPIKVFS